MATTTTRGDITLGTATDGKPDDDWVLTLSAATSEIFSLHHAIDLI